MSQHVAKAYREELQQLDHKIAQMGGLTEHNLGRAFDALNNHDPQLAERVILSDEEIDRLQADIESQVIQMIALRAPLSEDLRHIMAALKITGDLERIGDLAKNIAKRSRTIATEQFPKPLMNGLRSMVERALIQLKDVLDAYADRNADLALSVWTRDEQIDAMYNSIFRELLTYMMEDPRNITTCMHLLCIAKNIERMGDHTTAVAEQIHYDVTGEVPEEDRPKSDITSQIMVEVEGK